MSLAPVDAAFVLTPWALLTATAGLVAFQIGLYTLIGRERKSPYIINSTFPIFLSCLLIAAVALSSTLVPDTWRDIVIRTAAGALALTFLASFLTVYRLAIRSVYFVDSVNIKHLPYIRGLRRLAASRKNRTYTHQSIPIPGELKAEILTILKQVGGVTAPESRDGLEPQSLAVAVAHQGQGNQLLAELALAFFKHDFTVQYLTASRHPVEFIRHLNCVVGRRNEKWHDHSKKLVVIDAYSPHFAFTDSIYPKKDDEVQSLGIESVRSKTTYAGMHSASSLAFNVIQKQVGHKQRRPTLVIYEDAYALSDLESPEQYRIFVRHVMPSERMWDGMFTVFLEAAPQPYDWSVLQAYASMRLDLRSGSAIVERKADPASAGERTK